jgi:hypothetical protein
MRSEGEDTASPTLALSTLLMAGASSYTLD